MFIFMPLEIILKDTHRIHIYWNYFKQNLIHILRYYAQEIKVTYHVASIRRGR
jgi:hypothetical protein